MKQEQGFEFHGEQHEPKTVKEGKRKMTTEEKAMTDKLTEFLETIRAKRSKNTYFLYKSGMSKFLEWYGKSAEEILAIQKEKVLSENREDKEYFKSVIESFFKYLKDEKKLKANSARDNCGGIVQFLSFFGVPVKFDRGTDVTKVISTTSDYVPSIEEYRKMYALASLRDKLIISLGLNGYRIGDFLNIRKDTLPNLDLEAPIPFELLTEKESIIAKSFLSAETIELLRTFIPTTNPKNPFLFGSNGHGAINEDSINYALHELADKAQLKIPKGKNLRFHCFRKRFLSTCADLSIDANLAKILCGKAVSKDMLSYLSDANLKSAFLKVREALSMTAPTNHTKERVTELESALIEAQRTIANQNVTIETLVKRLEENNQVTKVLAKRELMYSKGVTETEDDRILQKFLRKEKEKVPIT